MLSSVIGSFSKFKSKFDYNRPSDKALFENVLSFPWSVYEHFVLLPRAERINEYLTNGTWP